MIKYTFASVLVILLLVRVVYGQGQIQSLENKLQTTTGNEKIEILNQLSQLYLNSDASKSLSYGQKGLKLSQEIGNAGSEASAFINIGMALGKSGKYHKAITAFQSSLTIFKEYSNNSGIAYNLNQIGLEYKQLKNYTRAKKYMERSLGVYKKMNDNKSRSHVLTNIGDLYLAQSDYKNAIGYYSKSLSISEKLRDKEGIASTLNTIGSAHSNWGNFDKALEYLEKALTIAKRNNLTKLRVAISKNIAIVKNNRLEYGQSKTDFEKTQEAEEQEYIKEIESKNIAIKEQSSQFLDRIDELNIENQNKELKLRVQQDDYNREILVQQHESEKKEQKIQILNAENQLKEADLAKQSAELKTRQLIIWAAGGLMLLLIALSIMIFNRYQTKRRANELLVKTNAEITKQKEEITTQKTEIEKNRDQLLRQNQQISDSINYAQRIQSALLTSKQTIKSSFPDSFILFKPKAKVSGDFYWVKKHNNKVLFAAVDCTGHGVPGAFMSIIGTTLLNGIVSEKEITQPSEVLKQLHVGVKTSLNQENSDATSRDGMDLAFCTLEPKTLNLQYAGSHNPLFIIRDGKLEETKGDKLYIGDDRFGSNYTNHNIQLQKNDLIYLFSDGYADQIGGPDNKKFYYQNFQNLLLEIHTKPMEEQKEHLEGVITDWIGGKEQIDDILVFGVKV